MIVAVDFDGVIVEENYPHIGQPMPYVHQAMGVLQDAGHDIIIHTCRTGRQLSEARNWLDRHEIRYHSINEPHPDNVAQYGPSGAKIYADVYIDDRNLGGFPGWLATMELLGLDPFAVIDTNDDLPY